MKFEERRSPKATYRMLKFVAVQHGDSITLKVKQDKGHIIFDIADNGIGMDGETSEKIFTPFFSLKAEKGTGLGLFISNKIIEQHGGEIIVTSKLGRGTLFRIKIPKLQPQSVPMPKEASPAKQG